MDNFPPPPLGQDPGDIYITDCANGFALFADDVNQLGIAPDEITMVDLDALSVNGAGPIPVCWDQDSDGYFDKACGGTDCDDKDPNVNPGKVEGTAQGNCADGKDNDCDTLTDGADPGCQGGGCSAGAEASGTDARGVKQGSPLNLLAWLLILVAASSGLVFMRRKR